QLQAVDAARAAFADRVGYLADFGMRRRTQSLPQRRQARRGGCGVCGDAGGRALTASPPGAKPTGASMIRRRALHWLPALALIAGCSTLGPHDPVQVQVVDVQPLPSESLELRFLCKLRVQNPNDTPIEYSGVYIELDVRGSTLASGVSDASGTVPRFG